MQSAVTKRRQLFLLGKILITLVLLLISPLNRSKLLFVLNRFLCFFGKLNTVNVSSIVSSNQSARLG